MKQLYLNLILWAISSCTIALSAQTSADNHKLPMSMSDKQKIEKQFKEMIKPQTPVVRTPEAKKYLNVAGNASLRATAEAMKLDSTITLDKDGTMLYKTMFQYNESGKTAEEVYYYWNNSDWALSAHCLYEYDSKGNQILETYYSFEDSKWILIYKIELAYNNDNKQISERSNYYSDDKLNYQYYYEFNTSGSITKMEYSDLRNGVITVCRKTNYEYDSKNRQTHYESQSLDENGEWYYTTYMNYKYDSQDNQVLYENYNWDYDKKELYLLDGRYYEYNANGKRTYYEYKYWNGSKYDREFIKNSYNESNYITYYEYLQDNQNIYWHTIENYTYAADKLSSTTYKKDTTIWRNGENKNISFTCTDYKYNEKGLRVSSESFNLDPETEQRGEKISSSETTYDSLGRTISMIQNYYEGESISSGYKTEYEYISDNNSYIYSNYYLNDEGNDWILSYKTKHEYVTLGNESYYYLDSNWNEETEDWETSSGYKSIYEGNSSNYTQMEYSWNKDAGDWVLTYGYRYAYEIDGENSTQINAYFDTDNNQWRVDYSYKTEVTEGNPKVCKNYILPGNDIENWGLTGSVYYYYSESGVANETIQTVDARIYTRQGTIHIDMEGVADLWIYTVNGACCYQSSISGTTDVSNLQGGIYIVVLQSDSGTKKVKVLVK